jgi:hypothetical protein
MEDSEFHFAAEDFEGCRLIRAVVPPAITHQTLSVAVADYLALWETDAPILLLNDATRIARIPDDALPVLLALVKRSAAEPRFLGSTWFTGGNEVVDGQLRALFAEAGRDPRSVFATEDDALAYLRGRAARRGGHG